MPFPSSQGCCEDGHTRCIESERRIQILQVVALRDGLQRAANRQEDIHGGPANFHTQTNASGVACLSGAHDTCRVTSPSAERAENPNTHTGGVRLEAKRLLQRREEELRSIPTGSMPVPHSTIWGDGCTLLNAGGLMKGSSGCTPSAHTSTTTGAQCSERVPAATIMSKPTAVVYFPETRSLSSGKRYHTHQLALHLADKPSSGHVPCNTTWESINRELSEQHRHRYERQLRVLQRLRLKVWGRVQPACTATDGQPHVMDTDFHLCLSRVGGVIVDSGVVIV